MGFNNCAAVSCACIIVKHDSELKSALLSGISSLALDSSRSRLYVSCMDNVIYQFDCAAFNNKPGKHETAVDAVCVIGC